MNQTIPQLIVASYFANNINFIATCNDINSPSIITEIESDGEEKLSKFDENIRKKVIEEMINIYHLIKSV